MELKSQSEKQCNVSLHQEMNVKAREELETDTCNF